MLMPRGAAWLLGLLACTALCAPAMSQDDIALRPSVEADLPLGTASLQSEAIVALSAVATSSQGWVACGASVEAASRLGSETIFGAKTADSREAIERTANADALTEPVLDPRAAAIRAQLGDLKSGWPSRLAAHEREAVAAWYKNTGYRPVWTSEGGWNTPAKALMDVLRHADEDGLDPADYATGAPTGTPDAQALAAAEIRLSAASLLYARDARGGRLTPNRISALITPKLELPAAEALLSRLAGSTDAAADLGAFQPAYPGYRALKAKLASLRADRSSLPMASLSDEPVAPSRRFASLTTPTRASRLEGDIVANMERWRWLPAQVSDRYVFVNIPEFRLRLIDNGRVAHETRVITGKADTPTPIFSGEMETAVVNPSWFIPPSIMKKEILPGLAADPNYAARRGYEIVRRGGQISVRQPPGERNALGFIKFLFPNQHAVYLHDTPNRSLFGASQRAFSHGCVRVEHPFALADFVLGHDWTETRLRKLIGKGERTIRLPEKLPVHLAYFTVSVDDFGELRTFDDIYGYNRRVRTALGLGG